MIIIESNLLTKQHRTRAKNIIRILILTLTACAISLLLTQQIKFNLIKHQVLNTAPSRLEKFGSHFIIGYKNTEELQEIVAKRAIGGIFITTRNIRNKTQEEIKQEIYTLQDIRRKQGLPPLWIATDQEGGVVSRLSPPLTKLPQLSKVISTGKNVEEQKDKVIQYAQQQGRELSEIGINLNFAPVVDLNKGIISATDKYSKIYQRAISTDKEVVAKVALWYCQALESAGVRCTIKHFPGLGRIDKDTHLEEAELDSQVEELTKEDWVPFREVMRNSQAFTMLGHAKLTAVDAEVPVSFSQKVVTEIIRNDWQHDGILITDDFCMQAAYGSKDGLEAATVKAINAGVDLILIAYDPDLYYEAMNALLTAEEVGNLDRETLEKSQKRLEQTNKIPQL